jgi:ribosomal protein S6--L-glutamate ligase
MIRRGYVIELWVEPRDGRPAVNPVMRRLLEDLAAAGAEVRVRVPEHEVHDVALLGERMPDLILLKTATALGISLAVAMEAQGVRCLNPAYLSSRMHDKAAIVARLAAAGLPVPETWLLNAAQAAVPKLTSAAASGWVTKPVRGIHGSGVQLHDSLPERLEPPAQPQSYIVDDGTWLIQERIGGAEPDVKVYVAGEAIFAGTKQFSATSYTTDAVVPLELDAATTEIVLEVGEMLGVRLYGVDLRLANGRPLIIDVNPFPGYRGFPDALPALRAEIERVLPERAG